MGRRLAVPAWLGGLIDGLLHWGIAHVRKTAQVAFNALMAVAVLVRFLDGKLMYRWIVWRVPGNSIARYMRKPDC
jgi:hypothetical protein